MIYSSCRMGLYDPVKSIVTGDQPIESMGFVPKFLSGGISGAIGSYIANPCDLIKIRQQGVRYGDPMPYKNFLDGITTVFRQEGIRGLYKGVSATVLRAAILTASQLSSYDHTKTTLLLHGWGDNAKTHIFSSLVAGLCTAIASSPVDVVKSKYMNDAASLNPKYKSALDCAVKTLRKEGFFAFYKGFTPNYIRLGGHCLLTLPLYEQVRKFMGLTTL